MSIREGKYFLLCPVIFKKYSLKWGFNVLIPTVIENDRWYKPLTVLRFDRGSRLDPTRMVSLEQTDLHPPRKFTIPSRWRALVRRNELGLILLGLLVGASAGAFVACVFLSAGLLHYLFFGVPIHQHLSSVAALATPAQALVPVGGGLILGICGIFIQKWRPHRPVDPIEANALQGGRMSLSDSLVITAQTVLSNGCGASVGLEAAYTQIGSGFASWLGSAFRLRRGDMRTLVGCGSAGAIAAAFGAPLTGAFYAFELILGTYTPFGLAPIGAAAIGGVLAGRALGAGGDFMGQMAMAATLSQSDMALLLLLGMICAAFGIGLMRAVTFVESMFKASRLPSAFQPAVGGLIIGALAMVSPHVLASGHGALFDLFAEGSPAVNVLVAIVFLKALASAVSIGSGFRGGMFFASLYLGGMIGKIFSAGIGFFNPLLVPEPHVCVIVGMAGLAVAIIGGPLTMGFLALETTGDFPLSLVMLGVSTIVSVIVRRTFGYSFATWRLHLRGESIRSAQDIGWMRDLTVRRLMRTDASIARSDMPLALFKEEFPLGSTPWVVGVDSRGRYAGMISVAEAHLAALDAETDVKGETLEPLLRDADTILLPQMNIKLAAQLFEQSESEALAVVNDKTDLKIVGLLTEAHVLRRYTEELDKARRELSGESWLREN